MSDPRIKPHSAVNEAAVWYYATRDVISEPPTPVYIATFTRPRGATAAGRPAPWLTVAPALKGCCPAIVSDADVEPSEGWTAALNAGKSGLSICFMHFFGKCSGRCANDPTSCQQLHIRREALAQLRGSAAYELFQKRAIFVRTVKAKLSQHIISELPKECQNKLAYLEFRSSDVKHTCGFMKYELAYRRWLEMKSSDATSETSTAPPPPTSIASPQNVKLPAFECCVYLCDDYPHCPHGTTCEGIHAPLACTLTRDKVLIHALRKVHTSRRSTTPASLPLRQESTTPLPCHEKCSENSNSSATSTPKKTPLFCQGGQGEAAYMGARLPQQLQQQPFLLCGSTFGQSMFDPAAPFIPTVCCIPHQAMLPFQYFHVPALAFQPQPFDVQEIASSSDTPSRSPSSTSKSECSATFDRSSNSNASECDAQLKRMLGEFRQCFQSHTLPQSA